MRLVPERVSPPNTVRDALLCESPASAEEEGEEIAGANGFLPPEADDDSDNDPASGAGDIFGEADGEARVLRTPTDCVTESVD